MDAQTIVSLKDISISVMLVWVMLRALGVFKEVARELSTLRSSHDRLITETHTAETRNVQRIEELGQKIDGLPRAVREELDIPITRVIEAMSSLVDRVAAAQNRNVSGDGLTRKAGGTSSGLMRWLFG